MRQRTDVVRTVFGLVAAVTVAMVVALTPAAGFADDAGSVEDAEPGASVALATAGVVPPASDAVPAAEPADDVDDAVPASLDAPGEPGGSVASVDSADVPEGAEPDDVAGQPDDAIEPPTSGRSGDRPVAVTSASATSDDAAEPTALPALGMSAYVRDNADAWIPLVDNARFGEQIRYVVRLTVPAGTAVADAELSATVPGYGGSDDRTTLRATLESGSLTCAGVSSCVPSANPASGRVGWRLGDLAPDADSRVIETSFVVRFGDLPPKVDFGATGRYTATAWTRAELSWADSTEDAPRASVESNEVVATAIAMEAIEETTGTKVGPPPVIEVEEIVGLPATGGPERGWLAAGLLSLVAGAVLVLRDRRS